MMLPLSKKTIELVAFLAMFLPASFLAAQEAWEFKPQLRYAAGTSTTQMVFEAYIEAETTNSAASSLYFSGATFALLFDSSLSDDALTALLETYTASETDLANNVASGGLNFVDGSAIFLTISRAPSNPPAQARACTPSSGSCEIIIGTFTIPSIVSGTTLSVAIGRYDDINNPGHVSVPATVDTPFVATFVPQGFSGSSVVTTDTELAFPPPAPAVTMSAAVTAVDESAVATIALSISPAAGSDLRLNYAIAADTDVTTADAVAADYVDAAAGSITISAGDTTANIEITVPDDNLAELAEVFVVTLSSVTAADSSTVLLGTGVTNTVTIAASNTPEVTLAGPAEVIQGYAATYTVDLSTEPTVDVVLTYAITGTATLVTHYTAPASGTATVDTTANTVTIPSGSTSGTFTIATINGAGNTNVVVTLSAPMGGGGETPTLGSIVAVLTSISDAIAILAPPTLSMSEGGGSAELVITAASLVGAPTTVAYTVTPGTAVAADHDAVSGDVMIPLGATSASISITAVDDDLFEMAESFMISLTNATSTVNVGIPSSAATTTVTIAANDTPEVTLEGPSDVVGGETVTYTVRLSTEPTADVTLDYVITGTAVLTTHYTGPASGTATVDTTVSTVTIPSGNTSGTFMIETVVGAGGESIVMTLSNPVGGGGEGPPASGVLTSTVDIVDVSLDLNGDGSVNGDDAVILYFASPESGVSTSLEREAIRRNILRAYSGLVDPGSAANAVLDPVLDRRSDCRQRLVGE